VAVTETNISFSMAWQKNIHETQTAPRLKLFGLDKPYSLRFMENHKKKGGSFKNNLG